MDEKELLTRAVPPLLGWYRISKRDLPWRKDRTPYRVLVSEFMLQQTRVEAVKERYVEFLRRFPTAEALAAASEEEVMKAWEGLGYYARARNLHRAAKTIAAEGFPQTWVGVRALAGVGDYTAGAISSIALGLKKPAVDGNVLRILTRLFADGRKIEGQGVKTYYSQLLEAVYPPEAGEFTEALMELGAIVCVPNGPPMCGACPWKDLCKAHAAGQEEQFPVHGEKKQRRIELLDVYVLVSDGAYALEKRGEGLLAGLYGFLCVPHGAPFPYTGKVLAEKRAKHVFTHVEWHMTGRLVQLSERPEGYLWATAAEIAESYALPSAFKAFRVWLK